MIQILVAIAAWLWLREQAKILKPKDAEAESSKEPRVKDVGTYTQCSDSPLVNEGSVLVRNSFFHGILVRARSAMIGLRKLA